MLLQKLHFSVAFSGKDCGTAALALTLKSCSSLILTSLGKTKFLRMIFRLCQCFLMPL